jgi:hypothetical protein
MPDGSDSETLLIAPEVAAPSVAPDGVAPSMVPAGPQRGALLAMTQNGEIRLSFVFSHMPEHLVRERERGGRGITEVFTVTFVVDAAEGLAVGNPTALAHGIHPELSVLDQLFRESWLLLSYGPSRLIPMTPMSMNVTETEFDAALNPIRAEITFRAERITLTTDLNLGRFVNAAAGTTHGLMRLYQPSGLPSINVE